MKLIVAAVSQRPPAWVVAGWTEYAKRMPRELPLELLEIKPEPRTTGKSAETMMALEASAHRCPTAGLLPPRRARRTRRCPDHAATGRASGKMDGRRQ
jgi:23S rRNA (pseudouridine1915-N3)-methyltransferase